MKKTGIKKVISLLMVFVLSMTMFAACSNNNSNDKINADSKTNTDSSELTESTATEETETEQAVKTEKMDINIASLKGPTSMGLVKVMEDSSNGATANNYKFTVAGAADEITAGIIKGDYDIAAIPSNLASVLYNKTEGGLVVAGINTLGVLYIVETGNQINSVEDLKGKTIYSTGKGTTPEYTLNYLLTSYGIDLEKDVTIEYKSEPTEVAALLSKSTDAIAMLPQPFVTTVTMNNKNARVALDVAKEWDKVVTNQSTITTGVVVVNKKFLENNKEAVDAFLSEYEASSKYVNDNVKEAAALIEKYDIFKAAVAEKAIPFCNITFIQGEDMQTKLNGYLEVLLDQNPKAIGGKLPSSDFYYKK